MGGAFPGSRSGHGTGRFPVFASEAQQSRSQKSSYFEIAVSQQALIAVILRDHFNTLLYPDNAARVAELADALVLEASGQPWGFKSPLSHHPFSVHSDPVIE